MPRAVAIIPGLPLPNKDVPSVLTGEKMPVFPSRLTLRQLALLFLLPLLFAAVAVPADDVENDEWEDLEDDPWAEEDDPFADPAAPEIEDPWEGWNRRVFAFNEVVDRYAARPLARGYRATTPRFLRRGVRNVFANLADFSSSVHGVLQLKPGNAGRDLGRFTINTTVGVGGLFDVASRLEIDRSRQDLGLTLARWGVPEGNFVMLPFLGPSTVRDGMALYPDRYTRIERYLIEDWEVRWALTGFRLLALREELLDLEDMITGDRYIFIRDYYLSDRRGRAGQEDDDFGFGDPAYDDWDDDDW